MSDSEKEILRLAINQRLSLEDAREFRESLRKLGEQKIRLSGFSNQFSNMLACGNWLMAYEVNRFYSEVIAGLNDKIPEGEHKNLEEKLKEVERYLEGYRADEMPSCTKENLKMDVAQQDALERVIGCLARNFDSVYHGNNSGLIVECSAGGLTAPNIVDSPKKQLLSKYIHGLGILINETIIRNELGDKVIIPQHCYADGECSSIDGKAIVLANLGYFSAGMSISTARMTLTLLPVTMIHDESDDEQFSAIVDSLNAHYSGPVVSAPMRLRLTPRLLEVLADVEYKGEKIFAEQVEAYKKTVGE